MDFFLFFRILLMLYCVPVKAFNWLSNIENNFKFSKNQTIINKLKNCMKNNIYTI